MSKLVMIEFATGLEVSPIADIPSGYSWTRLAVDAGEVASILDGGTDPKTGAQLSEVFLRGQKPDKDGNVHGRIVKGSQEELLELFNSAR